MRRFLIELLRFSGVLLLVLAIPMGYNRYLIWKTLEKGSRLPQEVHVLATGDSHVECTVCPKYLPQSENVALSSQRLSESFSKLRYYCNDSNSIKMVILSLNHFTWIKRSGFESETRNRNRTFAQRFGALECYVQSNSFSSFLKNTLLDNSADDDNPFLDEQALKDQIGWLDKFRIERMKRMNAGLACAFDFRGGFRWVVVRNLDKVSLEEKLDSHFGKDRSGMTIANSLNQSEFETLKEIVAFCQARDIELVLYNAPVHPSYLGSLPSTLVASIDSMAHDFATRHQVTYIDHSRFALPDSCMRDYDHVNFYGGKMATQALKDSLERRFEWDQERFTARKSQKNTTPTAAVNAVRVRCAR